MHLLHEVTSPQAFEGLRAEGRPLRQPGLTVATMDHDITTVDVDSEDLAIARVRRKESQRLWAKRLGISVPTLVRLERGDPGVGMGILATALWMIGRTQALSELAEPVSDRGALELDVRAASKRRAVRSKASIAAQLARRKKSHRE